MKLIWHIFLKDLRRLSVPLVLWGSLFVLQYLAYANLGTTGSGFATFLTVIWGLQVLAAWLLVPQLIHADALVDDNAAWRTRPISGARLLGAKLLGLFVMFCLWPALLTLPWWLHFKFSLGQTFGVTSANLAGFGILALVAAALAAITTEFLRYVAWSFVLFTVAGFGFFTFWAEYPSTLAGEVILPVLLTRVHLASVLLILTAVVVVALQYLTRRTTLSMAIGAVVLVSSVAVLSVWPWSAGELLARVGRGSFDAPSVSFHVANATAFLPPPDAHESARLQFHLEPVAEPATRGTAISWQAFNGTLEHGETGRLPVAAELAGAANWLSLSRASRHLAEAREIDRGSVQETVRGFATLSPAVVERWRARAGALRGQVDGLLLRGRVLANVPLRAGAGSGRGGRQIHVQSAEPVDNQMGAATGWFETQPIFDPEMLLTTASGGRPRWRKMQAVVTGPDGNPLDGEISLRPQLILPVGAVALSFQYRKFPLPGTEDHVVPDEVAMDLAARGISVAVVVFDPVARLSAAAIATEFAPDIVVEGSVEQGLRRARVEGKRVLLSWSGRKYADTEQHEPPGWEDLRVRALLRDQFIGVRVYQDDRRWFEEGTAIGYVTQHVVLAPDGTVQDRFGHMGTAADWQAALAANATGRTYLAHLQEELGLTTGSSEVRILRNRIAQVATAARNYDVALTQYLWLVEQQMGTPGWPSVGIGRYSLRQLANHPPTAARLRQLHADALEQLARAPGDVAAGRRLLAFADALRTVSPVWADFPRHLPADHPERWPLLADWITGAHAVQNSARTIAAALDLEAFFAAGRAWVQQHLQRAKGRPAREYADIVSNARWRWAWAGLRAVEILENAGRPGEARRLAREVLLIQPTSNFRQRLRTILQAGDTEFLYEISVNNR